MLRGTFNRQLDADVVTLYRDDWIVVVASRRAATVEGEAAYNGTSSAEFALAAHKLEILKERKQYGFLAMEYHRLGNAALRDKYIDLALKSNPSDLSVVFLRALQGQPQKIPTDVVSRIIERQRSAEDWSQLARTYLDVRDWKNAVISYCKSVIQDLEHENVFSAAFYLKELGKRKLFLPLFQETYEKYETEGDLWWAFRSLQELEWRSEAEAFVLRNEQRIEQEQDPLMLRELYAAKGDVDRFTEMELEEASTIQEEKGESGVVTFKLIRKKPSRRKAHHRC